MLYQEAQVLSYRATGRRGEKSGRIERRIRLNFTPLAALNAMRSIGRKKKTCESSSNSLFVTHGV